MTSLSVMLDNMPLISKAKIFFILLKEMENSYLGQEQSLTRLLISDGLTDTNPNKLKTRIFKTLSQLYSIFSNQVYINNEFVF